MATALHRVAIEGRLAGLSRLQPPRLSQSRCRLYATHHSTGSQSQSSTTKRRAVTIANDTGYVPWGELSAREKAARSTQQSFNFALVVAGIVATGALVYIMFTEIISPEGTTNQLHRALNKIKNDSRCVEVLGDPKQIVEFSENPNPRARQWTVPSKREQDKAGNVHLTMHFFVKGPLNKGTVRLHMIQKAGESEFDYQTLTLDVPGHRRIYLENAESLSASVKRQSGKLFGIKWW
ncbi:TIM21-domain-containing protein [Phyllosticta citribraziliensis]|uniref:Mitochondrial import inner membrane translocase subunit Tim21 n=1 Tax=Phyllosticta citribraziliensis TaxID=989973 RepID=A0ABR1LWX2_9PEZI